MGVDPGELGLKKDATLYKRVIFYEYMCDFGISAYVRMYNRKGDPAGIPWYF